MTYDPYQAYATPYGTPGGYAGIGNSFQTPFNTVQYPGVNSAALWNPLTAYQPQPAYLQNPLILAGLQQGGLQPGVSPHSLLQQLAAHQLAQQIVAQQLAAQQITAQQNPYGQPFGLQSPLLNQQGLMHPQVGQIGFGGQGISSFGQPGFGQPGSPFNQIAVPLAPQSWVGPASQLGFGQSGFGQTNPVLLAQLTARALQAQGITPGVAYQG